MKKILYVVSFCYLLCACTSLTRQEEMQLQRLKAQGVTVDKPIGNYEKPASVAGGGQPLGVTDEIRKARMAGLMTDDRNSKQRCSHQNPDIKKLYDEFLEKPLSNRSHHLLHTHYQARKLYNK